MASFREKYGPYLEKFTNVLMSDKDFVFCHGEGERKYFTIENNDKIYRRLMNELPMRKYPYLGTKLDFGDFDVCLAENKHGFDFYVVTQKAHRCNVRHFDNIYNAINHLGTHLFIYEFDYSKTKLDKFLDIMYEELGLERTKIL